MRYLSQQRSKDGTRLKHSSDTRHSALPKMCKDTPPKVSRMDRKYSIQKTLSQMFMANKPTHAEGKTRARQCAKVCTHGHRRLIFTNGYRNILFSVVSVLADRPLRLTFTKLILFLLNEPMGIKQNKIINHQLGTAILRTFGAYDCIPPLLRVPCLLVHLAVMADFITRVYSKLAGLIIETVRIFQGKNFNRVKKRTERVDFKFDRIIIATFLISLVVLFMYNLIGYYVVFMLLLVVRGLCTLILDMVRFCLYDFTEYFVEDSGGAREMRWVDKICFGWIYAIKKSVFSKPGFWRAVVNGK